IAQGASAIWVIRYFYSEKSMLKLKKESMKLDKNIIKEIISIGFAPFSMQLAASTVTMFLNNSLSTYGGDMAVSSMGIIHSITMMILMPIFGINQGVQPIIGFNYGAERYERVKEALRIAIISATTIAVIGFIIIQTVPEKLFSIFMGKETNVDGLMKIGVKGLRINLSMLPVIGFQIVSSNYFQATGKPKKSAFLGLSRQVLILIPALIILPRFFGLTGVWAAAAVSDLLATITTGLFLFYDLKTLGKEPHSQYKPRIDEN
ncbi:MAG TPA: MATE family efflux transporter, partial [Tissierellales bacterium]|nr:MATE family efflux transporter [Tissierellales bacterium]